MGNERVSIAPGRPGNWMKSRVSWQTHETLFRTGAVGFIVWLGLIGVLIWIKEAQILEARSSVLQIPLSRVKRK